MVEVKREVAKKVNIGIINSGKYVKTEGWEPNYIEFNNERISRVNIIGTIIDKNSENRTLIVDDGTGKINVRSFEDVNFLDKANIGDIVLLIGRPREFNNDKFISPEIIKKINSDWLKLRKKELENIKIESNNLEKIEEGIEENLSSIEEMVRKIKKLDKGEGVVVELLINNKDDERLIENMMQDGIIFEIKPGKIKVLE